MFCSTFANTDPPSNFHVSTKRAAASPNRRDVPLSVVFGIIGSVALLSAMVLALYFWFRARREKRSRPKIDLLEDALPSVPVADTTEKPLPHRPQSTFTSSRSRAAPIDDIPLRKPPMAQLPKSQGQQVRYIAGPVRSAPVASSSSRSDLDGQSRRRSISEFTADSFSTSLWSMVVPPRVSQRNTISAMPSDAAGVNDTPANNRFMVTNMTENDKAQLTLARTQNRGGNVSPPEETPPPVYQSRSMRKRRPSAIAIPSPVDEKANGIPPPISTGGWAATPLASPTRAYTVQVPVPASAQQRQLAEALGSPLMITSSYPVSSITVEDAGSVRSGLERKGRIVKLAVLLEDDTRDDAPIQSRRDLFIQRARYAGQAADDRPYGGAELPAYTPANDYEFPK